MELKRQSVSGLIGDFLTYGVGNIIAGSITILITPLLTRIFTSSEYGLIDIIQTTVGILAIIAALQLDSAVLRYYAESEHKKELLFTHLVSITIVSFVIVLVGSIFCGQISRIIFKGYPQAEKILIYSLLTVPSTLLLRHALIVFRALRKAKYVVIISSLVAIVYFLLTVIFIVLLHFGISGIFVAKFLAESIISLYFLSLFRRHYTFNFSFPLLSKLFKYSLPILPERLANICLTKANRYFLIAYVTFSDIAKFNIAQKVPALIMLAISGFEQAWFPYAFSIMSRDYFKEVCSKIFTAYVKLTFLLTILIILFSREIIIIFAPKEYLGVSYLVGLLGGDIVMFGAAQILAIGLLIKEKTQLYLAATAISAAINIFLNYYLIRLYGILGAALSLYLANFAMAAVTYYFAQRHYDVTYNIKLLIGYFISIPIIAYLNNTFIAGTNIYYKSAVILCILLSSKFFLKKEINFMRGVIKERFFVKGSSLIQ